MQDQDDQNEISDKSKKVLNHVFNYCWSQFSAGDMKMLKQNLEKSQKV